MTNFGRVTAAVLDEVITRLTALRDGDGFTFTSGWAHDDYVNAEAQR